MKWRLFEPKQNSHPKSLIIMPNSFGGTLIGAAGIRAQIVANKLGMRVLGLERTSALRYAFVPWLRKQLTYRGYPARLQRLAEEISNYIEATFKDLDQLIVAGHSAGGVDAALLAASHMLPITHIVITDPAGMRKVSATNARLRYARYNHRYEQDKALDDATYNTNPYEPLEKRWRGLLHSASEMLLYGRLWSSNITIQALMGLAADPARPLLVHLSEFSFNGTPAEQQASVEMLTKIRSAYPDAAPSDIQVVPDSRHSTFNTAHYRADAISEVLELSNPLS
jgi:pimeloyl-ACP methyl ester carboxylesterase